MIPVQSQIFCAWTGIGIVSRNIGPLCTVLSILVSGKQFSPPIFCQLTNLAEFVLKYLPIWTKESQSLPQGEINCKQTISDNLFCCMQSFCFKLLFQLSRFFDISLTTMWKNRHWVRKWALIFARGQSSSIRIWAAFAS